MQQSHQNAFEHNSLQNVPTAIWVGKATVWMNNPVNTRFDNLVFYKNTFDRGTAAITGSKAQDIATASISSWRSANTWIGFESMTQDLDKLPAATIVK